MARGIKHEIGTVQIGETYARGTIIDHDPEMERATVNCDGQHITGKLICFAPRVNETKSRERSGK